MHVTLGVTPVDLFDRIDAEFATQLVPDQALEPIETVEGDGLEVVWLGPEF